VHMKWYEIQPADAENTPVSPWSKQVSHGIMDYDFEH
jgi:hypothetical protein